ncbi:MAG: oligosaccharide flippase family protein [Sphingomonadaceae bacterium]
MSTLNSASSRSAGTLLRGLSAYGGAELATRIVRLGSTIVIARQLAPDIVGQAALALTLFELVRVLAKNGLGQQIIACSDQDLDATCNTAHSLFWMWSWLLVAVQLLAAATLWLAFGQIVAGAMLAVLSLVYVWMPGGLVQCHLGMREGLTGRTASTAACQSIADALLTAALLLIWPSPWSIVLPKLLTAPIWLMMTRRNRPWTPNPAAGRLPIAGVAKFSGAILMAETLFAIRTQCDNLIIAIMMGTSSLGTYFFAYNAGIGIVSSLVSAFGTVAFPMLCAAPKGAQRYQAMKQIAALGAALLGPLVILQGAAAHFYVPLVFGDHWASAAPLVAILCLSGLPLLISTLTTIWQRSQGQAGNDARNQAVACVAALSGLAFGATSGSLEAAATGLVVGQALAALFNAAWLTLSNSNPFQNRMEKFS